MSGIVRIATACVVAALVSVTIDVTAGPPASADKASSVPVESSQLNWAQKMFSELEHDFGTVAKFSDVKHVVDIKNDSNETVTLEHVATTCTCIKATFDKTILKPQETSHVELRVNTTDNNGHRDSNLDVRLRTRTAAVTVRVPLQVDIRSDVTVQPGKLDFGGIELGAGAELHLTVAGPIHIKEVKSLNPLVTVEFTELTLPTGGSGYDLKVQLSSKAPLGEIHEQLTIVSDDQKSIQLPVGVHGKIEPVVVVNPEIVPLGNLSPGQSKRVNLVVRAHRPVQIEKMDCVSKLITFTTSAFSKTPSSMQIVGVTITAPLKIGDFSEAFELKIAGQADPATFKMEGKISGPVANAAVKK